MNEATINIKVKDMHTFFTINGQGIAYEIAEELTELAKNSDMETLLGIEIIKQRSN